MWLEILHKALDYLVLMRVALNGLFLDYPATGTGQYLRELVSALRTISQVDEFVLVAPHADPSIHPPFEIAPPRFIRDDIAKLEFEQSTFPRASKRMAATLAHVPHFGPALFPGIPSVVTIHDLIPLILPAYRGAAKVRLYTYFASIGAKRARAILADSIASARDIEIHLGIARDKIHTVLLAADARYQPQTTMEMERVRAKYDLPERFVLYLGGFDVRKNVGRVIETFAGMLTADSGPQTAGENEIGDWRLVIAGKLPERDSEFFPDPRLMAERFGVKARTQFIGFVAEEDKPALYGAARVFLYPSLYEGFGLPPLEAMACGTPVIVSNTSSLPEVAGDAGMVLAPEDAKGWGDALLGLVTNEGLWNERRALGMAQAGRFSWERCARETLEVYRGVAGLSVS